MSAHPGEDLKCPKCGAQFPLSEVVKDRVREEMRADLAAETERFRKEAEAKARESVGVELADQKGQVKELQERLAASHASELKLLKREREVEERSKTLDLAVERQVSEQTKAIEEAVATRIAESQRLKDAEAEKQIQDLRTQLETALRKAEQGSQQLQGEVQELELEAFLKDTFPLDIVSAVKTGARGADLIQEVFTRTGTRCGTILWESKRTKEWSEGWLEKLRDDQRRSKSTVAVIVTKVLPKEIQTFGLRDTVWVTGRACLLPLALALREWLEKVAQARIAAEHKDEMVEALYRYVTSGEFRQRVDAVDAVYKKMKAELDSEMRTTTIRWSRQAKILESARTAMWEMSGDLQGLLGTSIQAIPALETCAASGDVPAEDTPTSPPPEGEESSPAG